MNALLIPILLVMAGLLVGVFFKSLSKYIKIPYTVILFAVGIALGILSRTGCLDGLPIVKVGINDVANIDPDFILYVFLPILIFDAAYEMNLHVFKKTLLNASILAGPGLVICMLLTACLIMGMSYLLPNYDFDQSSWVYALMFGGLISATDPVAVVALLQELKTSKRFSTLVDGESLLNDGTGIVCFMLFYSQFNGSPVEMGPLLYFCFVVVGSLVIGYIIARITLWFITRVTSEEIIQNSVMIIAAYITFIIAQYAFDISGVIALVVYGQYIAKKGRPLLKPQVNVFMEKFWSLLAYIANTLIFIIVGVIIADKVDISTWSLMLLVIVYIGLILIRFIMIYMLYPLMRKIGYGITIPETVILGWGGLRGALGMSLALMVYNTETIPEDIRETVLFLTAGIVTLTLCINATTSKWLLARLGLIKHETTARNQMYSRIHNNIRQNSLSFINEMKTNKQMHDAYWDEVEKSVSEEEALEDDDSNIMAETIAELRIKLLDKERETVNTIYEQGIISQLTYSKLLDAIDELYDSEGYDNLDKHIPLLAMKRHRWLVGIRNIQKSLHFFTYSTFSMKYYAVQVSKRYDLYRGFILGHEACLRLLDTIDKEGIISQNIEAGVLETVRNEIEAGINRANFLMDNLKENFPKSFRRAVTSKAIRMLMAEERNKVISMLHQGLITPEDSVNLLFKIDKRQEKTNAIL
ncbi:MAG: sodium:proton antiporter [Bacteroidaceae bacterium]|nr:sodium:proton antiporter [Bacteroidaceae bacterium]